MKEKSTIRQKSNVYIVLTQGSDLGLSAKMGLEGTHLKWATMDS